MSVVYLYIVDRQTDRQMALGGKQHKPESLIDHNIHPFSHTPSGSGRPA